MKKGLLKKKYSYIILKEEGNWQEKVEVEK